MGRKWELEKSTLLCLTRIRSGSHNTKEARKKVMMQIINDLAKTKQVLPCSFTNIQSSQIIFLTQLWKNEGLKEKTIVNRLGILRTVSDLSQFNIDIPSNIALGLKREITKKKIIGCDISILDKVSHPVTRSILSLQIHFGLTQSEAINIDPDLLSKNGALMVMKNCAHNGKERAIPILNEAQKAALQERRALSGEKITKLIPISRIHHLVASELMYLGLKTLKNVRALYIKKRFHEIQKSEGGLQAIKTLMTEIGIKKSAPLYALLNE